MSETTGATPRPWRAYFEDEMHHGAILDGTGTIIAETTGARPQRERNARLIVQAVNHHEELVAALNRLIDSHEGLLYEHFREQAEDEEAADMVRRFAITDPTLRDCRTLLDASREGK